MAASRGPLVYRLLPRLSARSYKAEFNDQALVVGGQCLRDCVPALLFSLSFEERADHAKVFRAVGRAEGGRRSCAAVSSSLLHPLLHQVVCEKKPRISGARRTRLLSTGAEAQRRVMADPSRRAAAAPGLCRGGRDQCGWPPRGTRGLPREWRRNLAGSALRDQRRLRRGPRLMASARFVA